MTIKTRVIPCLDVKDSRADRSRVAARTRNEEKAAVRC